MTLTELGRKYKTDKATFHGYTDVYDPILKYARHDVKAVLELGVHEGGSLRMWRDYFPNATIYGVDHLRLWMFEEERIRTIQADLTQVDALRRVAGEVGEVDLVVDDGPHTFYTQSLALNILSPLARRWYIVEDAEVERFHEAPTPLKGFLDPSILWAPNSKGRSVIYRNCNA